jgi:hypothetical protein
MFKPFFFVTDASAKQGGEFVIGNDLHPSLKIKACL